MKQTKYVTNIKKISVIAMFCALAFVLTYLKLPVSFLSLEIKDSVIVLCTLLFGPAAGVSIAVLVPLLELISHSTTGVYGLIMNMLSSVTFSLVTGVIYKYKKSFYGAIAALISGVFAVTAVMMLANLLVTPYYMGVSVQDVAALIPKLLLPFNLIKATLNAAVVLLVYKPLSTVLKKAKLIEETASREGEAKHASPMRSVLVTVVALTVIALSLAVIFLVLK